MANTPPDGTPDHLDDTGELGGTKPVNPPSSASPPSNPPPGNLPEWTPTSQSRQLQHIPRQPTPVSYGRGSSKRKTRADRSQSALYIPAWSVGLMVLLVFGIVGAILTLVWTLGGHVGTGGEPQVLIITAQPTNTLETLPTAAPTLADGQVQSFDMPLPTFALEGPTLPPIILSPTPPSINIGETVIVNSDTLRIRPEPSLDNTENFFANEGDRFTVIGGPQQGSGLTWWQVQDPDDPTRSGWAAADYLDVAIQ